MKGVLTFLLAASLLTGWLAGAHAQGGVTLGGTVEDQAGGRIPGAKVKLTNKATGEEREAVAGEDGAYSFAGVPPGDYVLTGRAPGFDSAEVEVKVGEQPPSAVALKLGIKVEEEVTVSENQAEKLVEPKNNANIVELDNDLLKSLPTQSEDILPVISNFLAPSAQGTEGLSVVVDGVETRDITVPTDAVRRVIINRNAFSAGYRRPGEGRAEITTRDGSRRRYDGNFGISLRNSRFDARNTFALTKPALDRRYFTGSFGGPTPGVRKSTFFFSANRLEHNEDAVSFAILENGPVSRNVPTSLLRTQLLGRFDFRPSAMTTLTGRYDYFDAKEKNRGVGAQLVLPEQGYDTDESGHRLQFSARNIFSPTLLNELRASFSRRSRQLGDRPEGPAVNVRGYFVGGPSQVDRHDTETTLDLLDNVTYTRGNHTLRFGGGWRPKSFRVLDRTNFGGTYTFQDIFNYLDGRPSRFVVRQGDAAVSFRSHDAYGFFEDEIRLRPWLTVTPGLRYDWQEGVKDYNNFGPRLSFALAMGEKTVLRGGAGLFYERLNDAAVERWRYDAAGLREIDIRNPGYPDPFAAGRVVRSRPNVWVKDPGLREPYMLMSSVSFERRLWGRTVVSVDYQRLRGVHLFRTRNLNAPLDYFGPEYIGVRPYPSFGLVSQIESSASSKSQALKVTFNGRFGKWFRGLAQYTYSKSEDDTGGTFAYPANSYDLRPEWGRSGLDQRHRFNYAGNFELPFSFRFGAILTVASAVPVDVTTGFDDNGDGVVYDRPPGATRNTSESPFGFVQLDLRLTKLFRLPTPFPHKEGKSERSLRNFEVSVDAFNVLNHPNTPVVTSELGSHVFGQPTTAKMARTLQFSLKYSF